jgi:malate dehydrogenase (oxaloacetate-decarboxylating)
MIQFEDFAQRNAMPLLRRYRDKVCCFNDDIQGTAAVTVGTLLAACRARGDSLAGLKIVFVGAGSAGCGIAEQVIGQMCTEGITDKQARQQIFMVDRDGLLVEGTEGLRDFQQALWQDEANLAGWEYSGAYPSLLDVVNYARPDVLIGVSGQAGLFSEQVIRTMKQHCECPIVLPLSNPSSRIEATPQQVIEWTDGQVIVATGSPFAPVIHGGKTYPIPQCNNSYIFPGIGLGVLASGATRISDEMMMAASTALASASPLANTGEGGLLPPLTDLSDLSREIAFVVGKVAQQQDHALEIPDEVLRSNIDSNFWKPEYRDYRRSSA